jgi:hypothetical protein
MGVNRDKPDRWKEDIAQSVDMYNAWFMEFAPQTFRETRIDTTKAVKHTLSITENLTNVSARILQQHPEILSTLRMATCPPLAVDRLIGLSGASSHLVKTLEKKHIIPPKMSMGILQSDLEKIGYVIMKMADIDICVWLESHTKPTRTQVHRASTIIADRLCGSVANPIIRNAQEQRQLAAISTWLRGKGYTHIDDHESRDWSFETMPQGTFSFRTNIPVHLENGEKSVNIPVDVVVMPLHTPHRSLPIFIEAKSAGDFTNVNKRRKEEAAKMSQLRKTYGKDVSFNLFLCGYFDSGYLGYEAAEGIDWIWEHRIDDLTLLGL